MPAAHASWRITVPAMPRPTRILTWLMLLMLIGGHWGVLQVVAWTGMLIDYSRDNPFVDAVEMTFDGEHPCAICKQVDHGLAADLGAERQAPGKLIKSMKLDAVVAMVVLMTPTPDAELLPPTRRPAVAAGIVMEPPRRPPRMMG